MCVFVLFLHFFMRYVRLPRPVFRYEVPVLFFSPSMRVRDHSPAVTYQPCFCLIAPPLSFPLLLFFCNVFRCCFCFQFVVGGVVASAADFAAVVVVVAATVVSVVSLWLPLLLLFFFANRWPPRWSRHYAISSRPKIKTWKNYLGRPCPRAGLHRRSDSSSQEPYRFPYAPPPSPPWWILSTVLCLFNKQRQVICKPWQQAHFGQVAIAVSPATGVLPIFLSWDALKYVIWGTVPKYTCNIQSISLFLFLAFCFCVVFLYFLFFVFFWDLSRLTRSISEWVLICDVNTVNDCTGVVVPLIAATTRNEFSVGARSKLGNK